MRTVLMCAAVAAISATTFVGNVRAEEKSVPLEKVPKAVTDAVQKMFPKAKMLEAAVEKEDDEIKYEVTVMQKGKKIDIILEPNGEIELLEKEIDLKDLPKAVTKTLAKQYPKATQKSAEAVYELEDGKPELEFYEIQLKTQDGKTIEAKIKSSGKVVKDDDDDEEKEEKESEKKEDE